MRADLEARYVEREKGVAEGLVLKGRHGWFWGFARSFSSQCMPILPKSPHESPNIKQVKPDAEPQHE